MTKTVELLVVILLACSVSAYAQEAAEPPLKPMSTDVMAQGGSFVAVAEGYSALFTNPAGFANSAGTLTLIAVNPWIYANPMRLVENLEGGDSPFDAVGEEIVTGGFGFGATTGLGYVGHGLGLGAILIADSYLYGSNLLGATGDAHATVAFLAGYAFSFEMLGLELSLGFSLRPMVRVHAPLPNNEVVGLLDTLSSSPGSILAMLRGIDAYYGVGLGVDLGLIAGLGPFRLGVAVQDVGGTDFSYRRSALGILVDSFGDDSGVPTGQPIAELHRIPMMVNTGIAYAPENEKLALLFKPQLHAEVKDVIGVVTEEKELGAQIHLGAEIELLSVLTLRAGVSQGYLTLGGGFRFLLMDLSFALFTQEMGLRIGDRPSSGLSVELALRF